MNQETHTESPKRIEDLKEELNGALGTVHEILTLLGGRNFDVDVHIYSNGYALYNIAGSSRYIKFEELKGVMNKLIDNYDDIRQIKDQHQEVARQISEALINENKISNNP